MDIVWEKILHSQTLPAKGKSSYLVMWERRERGGEEAQTWIVKLKYIFLFFHNMHQAKLCMFCDFHLSRCHSLGGDASQRDIQGSEK